MGGVLGTFYTTYPLGVLYEPGLGFRQFVQWLPQQGLHRQYYCLPHVIVHVLCIPDSS